VRIVFIGLVVKNAGNLKPSSFMRNCTGWCLPLLLLAGCAASTSSLQSASSSEVGCTPAAISISDYRLNMYTSSWTATCNNKTYYCSGSDTLKERSRCTQARDK